MSTPTEAHYELARRINLSDDYDRDAQLIADSEARAIEDYAVATGDLAQEWMRQCDQLRAEVERLTKEVIEQGERTVKAQDALEASILRTADQRIRAEKAETALKSAGFTLADPSCAWKPPVNAYATRCHAAEAQLATERARLDWLDAHRWWTGKRMDRATIDAAMKEVAP